jgi:outer membrane protein OmpA-like peptidoglycan-associated protein
VSLDASLRLPARCLCRQLLLLVAVPLYLLAGCAEAPTAPSEKAYPNVRQAARNAAHALANQIKHEGNQQGTIWVSPVINRHSGEITASGREMQVLLALDLKTLLGDAVVQSLGGKGGTAWNWVLAPSVQFEKPKEGKLEESWFIIEIAVVSPGGKKLHGITLRVNAHQFDATPSRFFRDAPLYLTGNYHQTRQEISKGVKSGLPLEARNRFIALEGQLQEAISRYEDGDYPAALSGFDTIISKDPENLPALSGRYQTLLEMGGSTADIESALAQLMTTAISQGNISFKFLFQVRSVEFRDDQEITRRYQAWLRQLAKQIHSGGKCLNVLGHASRSGSYEYNLRLSASRATTVMNQLVKYEPKLKGRVRAEGRSYQDNIVGSGSDDATDAIDRRVDFEMFACK